MSRPTITMKTANGIEVTAPTEAWIGALVLALSPETQAKVLANAEKYIEGPLVGGVPGSSIVALRPPALTTRKA